MIVPHYRRGESIAGYTQRCVSNREMRRLPIDVSIKRQICKEHAEHAREYLKQPFNTNED
jgi:hypothetical protein